MTTTEPGTPTMFSSWFAATFGASLPAELERPLLLVHDLVWASPGLAARGPGLQVPMAPAFLEDVGDYTLAGHWGHGVNSYALFFVERRGEHRRFLRLPYGNLYGDPDRERAHVLAFLTAYGGWQEANEPRLRTSLVIHNMGSTQARVQLADGREVALPDDDMFVAEPFARLAELMK